MSDFKIVKLLDPISINVNINPTGAYNPATTYNIGDSVSYGNSSYICITASTGNIPTNTTYWQLLASSSTNKLSTTARNNTGATIPALSVVYFSGASGNLPLLALSQANTESTSSKTVGITAVSIANNSSGEIIVSGLADNLNTSAYPDGSALWLSPTVAGGVTTVKPSAPNHMVFIGFVTRSHPTQGTIEIKVQNGFELEELHNVAISTPTDGQALVYNSTALLWNNHTIDKTHVGLGNVQNVDQTNPSNIVQDSTHRFVSDSEKAIWNAKQNALGFTPENVVNKVTDFSSPDNTTYPTTQAVVDLISTTPFIINTEEFSLVNADITNKFVTLAQNPILPQSVSMFIDGGINQRNSVDFQIIGNQCSWSGLGLDGFLSSGDVLIMQYQ